MCTRQSRQPMFIWLASCRISTTVATSALLEHRGGGIRPLGYQWLQRCLHYWDQSRPKLFDLKVRKAQALHDKVGEIEERVTVEDYDLNPQPLDKNRELTDPELVRTASGEIIRILRKPNANIIRGQLQDLVQDGYSSLAISFMHTYMFPEHE